MQVKRPAGVRLGPVRLARLLYFAAVLLASDESLDADLGALVPEVAVLEIGEGIPVIVIFRADGSREVYAADRIRVGR
ncbi:hypothetical protein AB0869_23440 [Micromonospora vinacea]|uniref:hypothetical protein n=1 Tax=Micromonospora vinacea TaxID=709878 RepID=UPI00345417B3